MRPTIIRTLLPGLTICGLLTAAPLAAQSSINGSVLANDGRVVPRAVVTLTSLDAGTTQETTTGANGGFVFGLVMGGTYELRVEALGFRPLVGRNLTVAEGTGVNVSLTLTEQQPPILSVDTVSLGGASPSHWRAGGVQFGGSELDDLPYRFDDLSSIAALASGQDESLGSQGLPGSMTLVLADGVPFYRAPHPLLRGEHLPDATFPRSTLTGVTVLGNAADAQMAGSAGGYVAVSTRTGTREAEVEAEGSWSGGPLWSSSEVDVTSPGLLTYHGAARSTFEVQPDTTQIVFAVEITQQETPLGPRISDAIETALDGLDPTVLQTLGAPSTEKLSRYSGMVRVTAQPSSTTHVFVRGAVGISDRTFEGVGPAFLAYGAGLPEESTDFSVAGNLISEFRPGLTFELRGGISGSTRTFERAIELSSAFLAGSGTSLGTLASGPAESSRTDVVLMPVARYAFGPGTFKAGGLARASNQTMQHTPALTGDFLFSDPASLLANRGYGRSTIGPEASFSTREFGAFLQYDIAAPGLELTIGGRFDFETLPVSDVTFNPDWFQASGLRNDDFPSGFAQWGAVGSLLWDPARTGSTRFFVNGTLQHGDIDSRALYQVFSEDAGASSTTFAGTGLMWPPGMIPAGAPPVPTLALLGPEARPPRSILVSGGLVQRLSGPLSMFVGGSFRRTDFLMRRRNLNLPVAPQAVDAYGRDVFGTLAQDGSLVSATGTDARRFAGFGDVWALDPTGWSEYVGVTAGLEHRSESLDFYGSYTRSDTEDNWLGGRGGSFGSELSPLLPSAGEDWRKGVSDFDVEERISAGATMRFANASVSALYRYRSGLPFTPRYRMGVDANGDGSYTNDVAYIPDLAQLPEPLPDWSCLSESPGSFAVRNSCRGPSEHSLDARLRLGIGQLGGRDLSLLLDAFNLIEGKGGIIDDALLLVDPAGVITTSPDGSTVTVPVTVNPDFGRVLIPSSRGRILRIGFRIG